MKKLMITSALTVAILLTQINRQQAQCESAASSVKYFPATTYKGNYIPMITLSPVEITAERKEKSSTKAQTLPMIEIVAERNVGKLLPATKYRDEWIASVQLQEVEITAEKKRTFLSSVFSFEWLFGKKDRSRAKAGFGK